jgi:hypothetical protein
MLSYSLSHTPDEKKELTGWTEIVRIKSEVIALFLILLTLF